MMASLIVVAISFKLRQIVQLLPCSDGGKIVTKSYFLSCRVVLSCNSSQYELISELSWWSYSGSNRLPSKFYFAKLLSSKHYLSRRTCESVDLRKQHVPTQSHWPRVTSHSRLLLLFSKTFLFGKKSILDIKLTFCLPYFFLSQVTDQFVSMPLSLTLDLNKTQCKFFS